MNWNVPVHRLNTSQPIRDLYSALREAPIIGPALRQFVQGVLPAETRVWSRINGGPGKGLWIHLNPRFEMDYLSGVYEAAVERTLSLHLGSGSVFYDVGAHIRVLSLVAARLVENVTAIIAAIANSVAHRRGHDLSPATSPDSDSRVPARGSSKP